MTQMVTPRTITAPVAQKRRGGILSVATVVDNMNWLDPIGLYETHNCQAQTIGTATWPCPTPDPEPDDKTFAEGPAWVSGVRFAGYDGFICKGIGYDIAGSESMAGAAYLLDEDRYIEEGLLAQRLSVSGSADWPDPVLIEGVYEVREALAYLEAFAAANYRSVPTIHMSYGAASLLNDRVQWEGSMYRTRLGSKISVGAGYDQPSIGVDTDGDPVVLELDAETQYMWVTGEVFIARGELNVHTDMNRSTNEVVTLAERPYVVSVECVAAAIETHLYNAEA